MKREMLPWRRGVNVWVGYLASITGGRGPLGNSPLPGYAEDFGFIHVEAEAMRMRNTAGSRLADMVTKEDE